MRVGLIAAHHFVVLPILDLWCKNNLRLPTLSSIEVRLMDSIKPCTENITTRTSALPVGHHLGVIHFCGTCDGFIPVHLVVQAILDSLGAVAAVRVEDVEVLLAAGVS